jgi:hypothetical protein
MCTVKVFLSWSGSRSRGIAEAFRGWLPSVIQAVRPYFSPDDVTKGARWLAEISKELEDSRVALLITTPENQEAPWLLFEAGALSKNFDRSRVCPLLFGGMDPTDVKGPLVQFQGARFCKAEMKKVLKAINAELGDLCLSAEVLENVFEMWWPKLEEQVAGKLAEPDEVGGAPKRSDRELLEEVLTLSRETASTDRSRRPEIHPRALEDLLNGCVELSNLAHLYAPDAQAIQAIRAINAPLKYMVSRSTYVATDSKARFEHLLDRIFDHLQVNSGTLTAAEVEDAGSPNNHSVPAN